MEERKKKRKRRKGRRNRKIRWDRKPTKEDTRKGEEEKKKDKVTCTCSLQS